MATIPRDALDYVTEQVNGLSADAQVRVMKVLESIEWTQDNVAECRELVIRTLQSVLPTYTDAAAQASADFYDASRELCVGEKLGAKAISGYDPAKTEGAVRGFVRFVLDGHVQTFNDQVLQRIDYEMKRSAGNSMVENGARDGLEPRYARVPTGAETCAFCTMLSSRGFVYRTRAKAGTLDHYHANCDCRVVCSWDTYESGTSRRRSAVEVEGYDIDALYDRYVEDLRSGRLKLDTVSKSTSHVQNWKSEGFSGFKDFADFVDGASDMEDLQYRCAVVEQEWAKTGLSDEYRRRLRQHVIAKKTQLRIADPGISGGAIYEKPREELEGHEKKGVDHLVKNGIVPVIKQEDPNAPANFDLEIDGVLWEMKNVTNSRGSIGNQLTRARKKFYKYPNLPKRIVFTCEGCSDSFESVCESLQGRIRVGETYLVLSENGEMRTISK